MSGGGSTTLTFTTAFTPSPTITGMTTTTAVPISTKLTATNVLVPTYNFDILVEINNNLVTITMNGPSNIWYGIGFGARVMNGTYAIIIRDVIEERMLGSHTSGSIISSFITVQNDTIDTINSIRTVVLTRSRIGDATQYSFPSSIDNINIIYAYGSSLTFNSMPFGQAGILSFKQVGGTNLPTISPTTMLPTKAETPSPTHAISDHCDVHASKYIRAASGISIVACVNLTESMIDIYISGPVDQWYGIGFGNTVMKNTYAIVADDTVEEYILGDHVSGNKFSSSINIINDTIISGDRHIHVSRSLIGQGAHHFSFPNNTETIDIIYGTGSQITYAGSSMNAMGVDTLDFFHTGAITPAPTQSIFTDCDVSVNKNIDSASGVAIMVCIDLIADMVDIYMYGPVDKWYSIGFGNTIMKNTYAIIADDTVEEYKLGDHVAGYKLSSSISIVNDTVSAGIRHVHVSRTLTGDSDDYFSFPRDTKTIDIIWSIGTQKTYVGSGMDRMGVNMLNFIAKGDTLSPTLYPTIMSTGNIDCTDSLTASQNVGDGFDLIIGFTIDCIDNTISINVEYNAFSPNWLGIVFGEHMKPDNGGYNAALVFTTGKSNDRAAKFYTYHITEKSIGSVVWQPELNWTKINQEINGNTMLAEYKTALSNTQWSTSTQTITFRYAYGSDMILKQHISTSDVFKYNMQTGGVTIEKDNISPYTCHGIMMWITWSFLASIGIMSSRFRRVIEKCAPQKKALWFLIHRTIQGSVVIFVIISFSIVVYYTGHNGNGHFDTSHKKLGLTVFIIAVCQPLNALIRPHPSVNGKSKPIKRFLWEIIHKGLGYSTWIMALVNCYLGLCTDMINSKTWSIVHCIWIIFIGVIFICLWIYDYWLVGKQNESSDTIGVGLLDNDVVKLKRKTHKASLSNSVELRRDSNSNDKQILNNDNEQYQLLENEQL
eukprot:398674_1